MIGGVTSNRPTLVLAAHGTREPAGPVVLRQVTAAMSDAAGGLDVRLAFVDVIAPLVADALADVPGPAVVVPAFLASGYHVRTDVPAQVRSTGRDDVAIAPALGPDPALVDAAAERLAEAGWRPGDAVVLAAAGSSNERALGDVRTAVTALADRLATTVTVGYAASAAPTIPEAVAAARAAGATRVALASWLLAPGLFQHRLVDAAADVVAEPLGVHPAVVAALLDRYQKAAG